MMRGPVCRRAALPLPRGARACRGGAAEPAGFSEPARFPEYYARSLAALGYPGARRAFQVGPGSVLFSGETALEWRLGDTTQVTNNGFFWNATATPRLSTARKNAESAVTSQASRNVQAVAAAAPCLVSRPLPGVTRGITAIAGNVSAGHAVAWDAPERWEFAEAWQGGEALRNGRTVAGFDRAATREQGAPTAAHPVHASGEGPGTLRATCRARLAPGATVSWHFWMPLYPVRPGEGAPRGRPSTRASRRAPDSSGAERSTGPQPSRRPTRS
jgi:hypothetical protein